MKGFKVGELVIDAGTPILIEGSNSPQLYTVLEGMGLRYKLLENGRRQVTSFVFPGDFLGLQAGVMGEMQHSVESSTAMTLCVFDRTELWSLFKADAARAFDLTWIAASEEHFLGEALLTIGQRGARERVAWALLKLYRRCDGLGLANGGAVPLPFRQQDLADALGLSLVHTNKMLSGLRASQVASWTDGRLQVFDFEALVAIVGDEGAQPLRRRALM